MNLYSCHFATNGESWDFMQKFTFHYNFMFEAFGYSQRLTGHERNIIFEAFIVMDNFIKIYRSHDKEIY